jgi:hypothetical protein
MSNSGDGDGNEHQDEKEDVALTAQENHNVTEQHLEILPHQIRSIRVARKMRFLTAMSGELT